MEGPLAYMNGDTAAGPVRLARRGGGGRASRPCRSWRHRAARGVPAAIRDTAICIVGGTTSNVPDRPGDGVA